MDDSQRSEKTLAKGQGWPNGILSLGKGARVGEENPFVGKLFFQCIEKGLTGERKADKIRFVRKSSGACDADYAGVAQWQSSSFPSWSRGFDSHHLLHYRINGSEAHLFAFERDI